MPGLDSIILGGSTYRGEREHQAMSSAGIDEILNFWFGELSRRDWFRKDEALDSTIASRFGAIYHELRAGVPASWLDTPEGYLAAVLVLDQFPRNMFRGDAR